MNENPHLTEDYKDRLANDDSSPEQDPVKKQIDLPDHHFLPWQQLAYDGLMSGNKFVLLLSLGSGRSYLKNAIEVDLKIIARAIEVML